MSFGYRLLGFGAFPSRGAGPFNTGLIGNSLLMNGSDESLDKTFGSAPGSQSGKRYIWATWVQPFVDTGGTVYTMWSAGTSGSNAYSELSFYNQQSTRGDVEFNSYNGGSSYDYRLRPTQRFRDNGWQHFLISYDSTQALASNRIQMYYNGEQIASFAQADYPSLNHVDFPGTAVDHRIGCRPGGSGGGFYKNYTTQHVFLDSQSIQNGDVAITDFLDIFTFGTNGTQFAPKADADIAALATTADHNSFCLNFSDNTGTNAANLGNDISDNNNDFSTNNLGTSNRVNHTPSKMFATWNQIQGKFPQTSSSLQVPTLTEGNLRAAISSGNRGAAISSLLMPAGSGKFAAKFTVNTIGGIYPVIGVYDMDNYAIKGGNGFPGSSDSVGLRMDGERYLDGSSASYGSAVSAGNTVEVELDMDNNTVEFLINGSAQGTISKTFTGNVGFMADCGTNSGATDVTAEFDYTPDDSNFKTLNTTNITAPSFQGIDYFDTNIWNGTGNGARIGDFVPFTDVYTVDNSAMWARGDSRILKKDFGGSGDRRTMTFSTWAKWTGVPYSGQIIFSSGTALTDRFEIEFATADNITIFSKVSNSTILNLGSQIDITDMSDWVNIVVSIDTDQASTAERFRLFVDGVQQTLDVTTDTLGGGNGSADSGDLCHLNSEIQHNIGGRASGLTTAYYDGYFAETVFIDGSRLDASSFGQVDAVTNRWVPKDVSGLTFGTNGFYLEYKVATGTGNGVGTDSAGSNHFTEEGSWATSDQFIDTPSKNFATLDYATSNGSSTQTLSEGNLTGVKSSSGFQQAYQNFDGFRLQENTGIYFAEVFIGADSANFHVGVLSGDPPSSTNRYLGQDTNTFGYEMGGSGRKVEGTGGGGSYTSYGASYTSGDIVGIEIDTDTGSINFHKNGVDQGEAFKFVPGPYSFSFASESGGGPGTINFGQHMVLGGSATTFNAAANGRFVHTPPTGAKALNSDNMPAATSKITAWAWIKNRSASEASDTSHILVDRLRGVGKVLNTDTTTVEETDAASQDTVQRFFQRGVRIGNDVQVSTYSEEFVLWQWLVGESATTGTANDSGSINSTVIAAEPGHFSIVSWTGNTTAGATVGHGLGGTPEFIIAIARNENGENKPVYHKDIVTADTDHIKINELNPKSTAGTTIWDGSAMSTTVVGLGAAAQSNSSNASGMIAYCFRSVPGVCKVGAFIGNGVDDGPFINCGFKPAWLLQKNTAASEHWSVHDTARNPFNPLDEFMKASSAQPKQTSGSNDFDFLSYGFKARGTDGRVNNAGVLHVYMAMAEIGGNGTLPPTYGR